MVQLNVHVDDDSMFRFKELKAILKCKTNEETLEKLIDFTQLYLQQKFIKPNLPKPSNQHNNKTSKLPNNHNLKIS